MQDHLRLNQRLAAFAAIAGVARADDIVPSVFAAAVARDNVINRQVITLHAAILAGETIAAKYGTTRQL